MLVRLFVLNMDVLDGLEGGFARLTAPLRKIVHAIRRNTRAARAATSPPITTSATSSSGCSSTRR